MDDTIVDTKTGAGIATIKVLVDVVQVRVLPETLCYVEKI